MYKAGITRRIELAWVKQGKLSLSSYICHHKGAFLPLPLFSVSLSLLSLFLQVSFSQCISWKMQIIRKNKCMTDADVSTPTENVWNGLRIKIMQISCYGQCSRQISTELKFLQDLWTMCKPPGTSEHKIRGKNLYKRLVCTSGTSMKSTSPCVLVAHGGVRPYIELCCYRWISPLFPLCSNSDFTWVEISALPCHFSLPCPLFPEAHCAFLSSVKGQGNEVAQPAQGSIFNYSLFSLTNTIAPGKGRKTIHA